MLMRLPDQKKVIRHVQASAASVAYCITLNDIVYNAHEKLVVGNITDKLLV